MSNSIIIHSVGDGNHLGVQLRGHNWPLLLNLVQALPNRQWDEDNRRWLIPVNLLPALQRDAEDLPRIVEDIDPIQISLSTGAQELYGNWRHSIDRRYALQKGLPDQVPDRLGLDGMFLAPKFPRYQQVGAYFLYQSKRVICGDPTGTGKTPVALAATALGFSRDAYKKAVFVCEAQLKDKMAGEVEKFVPWPAFVAHGTPRQRNKTYRDFAGYPDPAYLIIGMPTCRQGIVRPNRKKGIHRWNFEHSEVLKIRQLVEGPTVLIIDEIQHLKHYASLQTRGVEILARAASHVYGLSATYIEGRLEELHSVFRVLRPTVFGDFWGFSNRYINPNAWEETDKYLRVSEAKELARPYVIRRRSDDIDDEDALPKVLFLNHEIALSVNQRALYREVMDKEQRKREEMIELRGYSRNTDSLWKMNRERQACLFPEIIDPSITESPKFDYLVNLIEDTERDAKFVIFSFFQRPVEILIQRLGRIWNTIGLHGGMKVDRGAILNEFQTNPEIKILVSSDLWRQGQDMEAARHLINFDLLWNPAHMAQRAGRIRRFTSEFRNLVVHTLITTKTVEEHMFKNKIEPKQKLMLDFMDDGYEGHAVSRETIRDIVRNYRG